MHCVDMPQNEPQGEGLGPYGKGLSHNKKWFVYEMRLSMLILNKLDVYQMGQPTPKHLQMQALYKMGWCWFKTNLCTKWIFGMVFQMRCTNLVLPVILKPNLPVQNVRKQPLKKES